MEAFVKIGKENNVGMFGEVDKENNARMLWINQKKENHIGMLSYI